MDEYTFDFYYGHEAGQYSFYRIPKALFTDEAFKSLSCEAKVLYGLMLDRMGLSMKNNWVDENNRVYIYFTLEDAKEAINCGQEKCVKLFAELDNVKGIGLIERKKQGLGKPARIYVKNFVHNGKNTINPNEEAPSNYEVGNSEVLASENQKLRHSEIGNPDIGKPEVQTYENQKSRHRKNRSQDFGKTDSNYTDINNTKLNNIYSEPQSIYHHTGPPATLSQTTYPAKNEDTYNSYRQIIKENIDYDCLIHDKQRYRKESVQNQLQSDE